MKRILGLLFLAFNFFFVFAPLTHAQEVIRSFDVTVTAHKNGEMNVSEKILYDFGSEYRHGIYRYIPLVSKMGDLYRVIDIKFIDILRDGKNEKFTLDTSSDKVQVKIGDPDRTINGVHEYLIDYSVKNGIGSNYEDHDEIYWNVTGDEWDVPIATASATLLTDFDTTIQKTICFTGESGSIDANCTVTQEGNTWITTTSSNLYPSQGMTFVSSFPVGTFPKSVLQKSEPIDPDFKIFLLIAIPLFILANFVLAPYLLINYFRKRNKTRYGKPVVNFDFPELNGKRLTPSEAGTTDNMRLDRDDIIATIFDLAIRKYLKIEEIKTKGKILGIGNSNDFKLTKLKEGTGLNPFEMEVMTQFFSGVKSINLKSVKMTYTDFADLEKKNFSSLIEKEIYKENPKTIRATYLSIGIVLLALGGIILGPVFIYLYFKTTGRTNVGDEMDWKVDGLKIFLKATNRYNTWQADNMIFIEKMIPYAMALGLIDQYMKQLKVLNPDYSPSWYSGSSSNFYAMYPLFVTSASSGVTTSAPSSSSGFSGGSSGGGGGGGGGGSW